MLRDVHIESVVGDEQKQGNNINDTSLSFSLTHAFWKKKVLKNVGKIEKFIVDQLRKMLDDELVFPSYQLIELN